MRVLQIHNAYRDFGGEDAVVRDEADLLSQAGHSVSQHLVRNPSGQLDATLALAVSPWNPISRREMSEVIEETKPDVAHVHNTWFAQTPSVFAALSSHSIPTVMSLHNYRMMCLNGLLLRDGQPCTLCVGKGPGPGIRYRCYRGSLAASAMAGLTIALNRFKHTWADVRVFLANSEFVRDTYVEAGLAPERVHVKPNFTSDPGKRHSPAEESNVVLYVGRLSSEKGVDFLCDLWERHAPQHLVLRMIGDGPEKGRLEERYSGIEFVGQKSSPEVAEEMLGARSLVFPSLTYESCPLAIVEAFSAGLPAIANRRGAMAELVGHMNRDWARKPEDMEDWHEGLSVLLDDREVARASIAARQTYEAHMTPEIALSELEEAYSKAVD